MDYGAHLRETARHIVWMASLPGELALKHAMLREQELIASHPMYAVLPALVREARSADRHPAVPQP